MPNRDIGKTFAEQRQDYSGECISDALIEKGPFVLFEEWYQNALQIEGIEVNAMCISTVSPEGQPSSRMVLLKGCDEQGFCFYSNYESRKGEELKSNNKAALLFYWGPHERQIRIEGTVEKLPPDISDSYFASRPIDAQISASVSPQSQEVKSRADLTLLRDQFAKKVQSETIARPSHWGGYCLAPHYFEFWQGQASRFHDRVAFTFKDSKWHPKRLAP